MKLEISEDGWFVILMSIMMICITIIVIYDGTIEEDCWNCENNTMSLSKETGDTDLKEFYGKINLSIEPQDHYFEIVCLEDRTILIESATILNVPTFDKRMEIKYHDGGTEEMSYLQFFPVEPILIDFEVIE